MNDWIDHAEGRDQRAKEPAWGPASRIGFRFLFAYFVLYIFPFPVGYVPWTDKLSGLYLELCNRVVEWVGAHILQIEYVIATEANGSGDRTADYVLNFCQLALAVVATVVWSLIDRRASRHERLLEWLRIYVRVYLGAVMLSYGFAKIFDGQFSAPSPGQLLKTYGESSPMNLLWTFMGSSQPYTMFAGFMEAIPGALLFFRRTTGLAALLLLAVMGNVVLLNFCYDVPVKLFSTNLWLMSLFLAGPSIPRLVRLLILNRSMPPAPSVRLLETRRARIAGTCLYVALSGAIAYQMIVPTIEYHIESKSQPAAITAIRAAFRVEEMTIDGKVQPPLTTNGDRWNRISIRARFIRIYWMDGRGETYVFDDEITGPTRLDLRLAADASGRRRARLDLRQAGDGYVLEGEFEGKKVTVRLARIEAEDSLLLSRGFHWINEVPFNR